MKKNDHEFGVISKTFIEEKDYNEIKKLSEECTKEQNIILKLELDYKIDISKQQKDNDNSVNEFLYYINDELVSYIGISCFNGVTAELNGMTHPKYRKRGIFKKLFLCAVEECRKRGFKEILLLSDENSKDGIRFITSNGGQYKCSEYSMVYDIKQGRKNSSENIVLREAGESDFDEIKKQDSIYWGSEVDENYSINISESTKIYIIEKSNNIIGKIHIEYNDESAYIFGFGILPEFRCNGYGRNTIRQALNLILEKYNNIKYISLDVACENKTALNLYKECGFYENSSMNYYELCR